MTDNRLNPGEPEFEPMLAEALQARWPTRHYGEARLQQVLAAVRTSGGAGPSPRRFAPVLRAAGAAAGLSLLLLALTWLLTPDQPSPAGESPAVIDVQLDAPDHLLVGGVRLDSADSEWDGYGEAVDLRGDLLVIGASEWNQLGAGSAYVYRLVEGAWQLEAHLVASDRERGQFTETRAHRFGDTVAIGENAEGGDVIAIGAPGDDDPVLGQNVGAVYIFERGESGWVETAKLIPDTSVETPAPVAMIGIDYGRLRPRDFGARLALSGNLLAVGGDPAGRIAIYQRGDGGWQPAGQFRLPSDPGRDLYLAGMSLHGDALALSVFYALPKPEFSTVWKGRAAVYVYENSGGGWFETLRYRPEGDADLLFFGGSTLGASVALGGDGLLAVGLPGFPDWSGVEENLGLFGSNPDVLPEFPVSPRGSGAVYLFERTENSWTQVAALTPAGSVPPPGPGTPRFDLPDLVFPGSLLSEHPEVSFFGATVDIDSDQLAVTSGFSNATYVFRKEPAGWQLVFSLKPANEKGEFWEDSAQVAALSGLNLVLGTPGEFGNSAYVFRLCDPADLDCR